MTAHEIAPPRFYGGVMVAVSVLLTLASLPGQTVIVGLFNQPMREGLGLSVTQISLAYTIGTILAALPLTRVGRFADRFGVRRTVGLITVGFCVALALAGFAQGVVSLTVAFFFIRFLGQGSLGMLGGHVLAMWYERRLGTMESIRHVAMAIGSGVAPLLVLPLIVWLGWQQALVVLAGVVAVSVLPVVFTVFRNRPEDLGQHLDGDRTEHETHDVLHGGAPPPGDPAFTLRQAMGTRAYWVLLSAMAPAGIIGTALLFHMQTLLESVGADPANAAKAIAPWPIATAASMLLGGWLADRVPAWVLVSIANVVMGVSCLVIWGSTQAESLARFEVVGAGMLVFGLAMGLSIAAANPAVARFFGRTHHGSIRGSVSTVQVAGTGAGPLLAGWLYEMSGGSFASLLAGFAIFCVPLTIVSTTLRKPTPPEHPPQTTPDPDEPDPPEVAL
ncbi:MAG: MFS transporter [Planctomycetota bacterium]